MDGDCVKHLGFVVRAPGLSREAFEAYWLGTHAPLVAALPGLRRYCANLVDLGRFPGFDYDGFSELWFDSEAVLDAALASPQGQAVMADVPNFVGHRLAIRTREWRVLWPEGGA